MALIPTTAAQIAEFADALYGVEIGNATLGFVNSDVTLLGGLNNTLNAFYTYTYGGNNAGAAAAIVSNVGIIAGKSGLVAADVTAAVSYVQAQLNANPGKEGQTVNSILGSFANLTSGTYMLAAAAWVSNVNAITSYMGNTANTTDVTLTPGVVLTSAASIFNLTTGIDNVVGSNMTVTGTDTTITGLDTINLTGTGNTFNVNTAGAANLPLLTVAGVQTLNLVSSAGLMGNAADVSGWTGLTQANIALTVPGASETVTAAGTTNVALSEYAVATYSTTVQGGANVTVTEKGVTTGAITVGSSTAPTGTVTVTDNSSGTSAIAVTGGTTVNVTDNITNTAPVVNGTPVTVTGGAVSVTGGSGTTTTVSVTQTPAVATVTGVTAVAQVETYTVTGTVAAGNTMSASINGVTYSVTVGSSPTVTTAAQQLATAITGAGLTVSTAASGAFTVTASVPGTAFTVGAITSTGGGAATLGDAATTANTAAVTGVNGIADGAVTIADPNQGTTTASTITTATLDGYGAGSTVKSDALTTLTMNNSAKDVTVTDVSTKQTLALGVNNLATGATLNASAAFTTVNVTTGAKASSLVLNAASDATLGVAGSSVLTLGSASTVATGTAINVSGAAGLTYTGVTGGTVTSITSTSSGVVTATLGIATNFTGGSGQDIVTIATAAPSTQTIKGGTATNNEIIWNGTAAPTSLGSTVSGFTTLGVGTAYANVGALSTAANNFQMATLTGYNALDVVGGNTTAGTLIGFTGVTAGTSLAIDGSVTNGTTADAISYSVAGSAGATGSMALTLGTAKTTGITVDALTLQDSASTPNGIGTVSVVSNGSAAANVNTITALTDANLTVLNVSGAADFTVTNAITDAATSLTINATETGSNGVTLGGVTDNTLATLGFTGTAAVTVTTLTDSIATTLTINDSDSGAVAITNVANGAAHNLSAATLTIGNTGTGTLSIETTTGITDNTLATLNLSGSVAMKVAGDTLATGVTVAGSTDNAVVSLALTGASSTHTDTIALGGGNDTVTIATGGGTENITLGGGNNTVTLSGTATTSVNNVTVGNGTNTVDVSAAVAGATDTIKVGTGADIVKLGTGLDSVTFGSHSSTVSTFDTLNMSANTTQSFATPTTTSQTVILTTNLDVITGLAAHDQLVFDAATLAVATATNLAGVAGTAEFAHGTYSSSGSTFTYSGTGADTLVTYGAANHLVSVVLVGTSFTTPTIASLSHTVTLA